MNVLGCWRGQFTTHIYVAWGTVQVQGSQTMREQGLEDIQYRYEHSGRFFVHAEA